MTRTNLVTVTVTMMILATGLAAGCAERAARFETVVDVVELREDGVLTRFKVAPTEGAMLWLDKRRTSGIVWDATLRAEIPPEAHIGRAGEPPVVRTVLDWRWDGPVLSVNSAVAGVRLPGAAPGDVAAARMIYAAKGCPTEASLAVITDGVSPPGKVLVVEDCAWTKDLFQAVAPRFRGLVLRRGTLPSDVFDGLDHSRWTPSILYIEGVPLVAEHLLALAPISGGLTAISLKDTKIPFVDRGMDVITDLHDLAFLDLSGTGIRDSDLTRLVRNGPRLDELRVAGTYLSAARLDKVSRMGSLRALDLSNTRANSETLARFDDLLNLRRLDLRATAVEDPGMVTIGEVSTLMELAVPFWLTEASAPHLVKLTELRVLRARAVRFSAAGLKHLGALGELLFLELNHVDVADESVVGLLPATSLEVLELEHCPIGDPGMEVIAQMPRLRKIEIEETLVTDKGFAALAAAPALEVVKAQELCGITDAGMAHVPAFPKLVALVLDETEVSDAAIPHFSKAQGLRLVSLETTRVTDEGRSRLRQLLPRATVR